MVKLGVLNSRMKDFYDLWLLSKQFDFDGADLAEAARLTFERRGTALPLEIDAFTDAFHLGQAEPVDGVPEKAPAGSRSRFVRRNCGFGGRISIARRRGPFLRPTNTYKMDCARPVDLSRWISIRIIGDLGAIWAWLPEEIRRHDPDPNKTGIRRMRAALAILSRER